MVDPDDPGAAVLATTSGTPPELLEDALQLAVRAMAAGDYSREVRATSRDEVGELATAFNTMAADLEAADRQRRELIANVSHELRTPIAALRAVLENVVDGVVRPEPATMAAALEQTERLGRLVAHLLDLSKIADGVTSLDPREFGVEPFLSGVLRGLSMDGSTSGGASRRRHDVSLALDVSPGLTAVADPERLHQVVANLVDNSCRHSPRDGTVTVRARALRNGGQEGRGLLLEVADQGPGIRPEDRHRVFERFSRGSGASAVVSRDRHATAMETAIAIRLDAEVLAWLREAARLQHGGQAHPARGGCSARRETPRHPMRGREAVAPIGDAPHTVCCLRLSAVQAALVPAGIARRRGRPQRQYE